MTIDAVADAETAAAELRGKRENRLSTRPAANCTPREFPSVLITDDDRLGDAAEEPIESIETSSGRSSKRGPLLPEPPNCTL
ncbi:hypothetical protein [Halalkalicoccus salilacus]|uniref:hypothetical protein n=1 Tax=Halalkalicoccus salilacus TaxID=3117459 RepID=UPI00300F5AA7